MSGRQMIYPYTMFGKIAQFPWKHYWTKGRGFRFAVIAAVITYPIFLKMRKLVNSPENVEMWKGIRQKRIHDVFETPTEHGSH